MHPEKNGHVVELRAGGLPYQLWMGDLWRCLGCGREIVAGFGTKPMAEHFESSYRTFADKAAAESALTKVEEK